jgi:hypothetical protein
MYETDRPARVRPREDRKLEQLARKYRAARELSEHVANSASEISELFDSEYKRSSEWGQDPRQE